MAQNGKGGLATVLDVAKLSGVSTATAARALGGYGSVRPETYERVHAAAVKLGYRPNGLARSMITGVTHSIGVVLADIENPFFYGALRGITDAARVGGFDILLANTDEDPADERKAVTALAERRVDGLILCPADGKDRSHLDSMIASGMPIVLLDRPIPGLKADTVGLDNRKAAFEATQSLLDLGHTRIGLITGGPASLEPSLRRAQMKGVERISVTTLGARAAGYRDALQAAGITARPDYLTAGGFHRDDAEASTLALMRLPKPPTAIVAFDSILTLGALLAFRRLGLRCPRDVSLVGFDDAEWAEVVSPPLTVVRQPVYEIGVKACELLLRRIDHPDKKPSHHRLKGTLIQRESTAPPS
ncbi:MAG: LacI family transcriptional regulator [Actinomycetota bacterium]|nr:LacI family transcriptional regulator [Actinomycetota bacterium]